MSTYAQILRELKRQRARVDREISQHLRLMLLRRESRRARNKALRVIEATGQNGQ